MKVAEQTSSPFREHLSLAGLVALILLTRWWSHADQLPNLDALSYARSLNVFDLSTYSPHPPGYLLFVMLGRLADQFVHDPNTAFLIVNALAQVLTVVLVFHMIRRLTDATAALLAGAVVAFHPLFWYYGSVTSVYTVEVAAALLVVDRVSRLAGDPSPRTGLMLGILWGLTGGIRQSTAVLLAPLVLWALFRQRSRVRVLLTVLGGALIGVIVWFVPLMILAGGWSEYCAMNSRFFWAQLQGSSPLFSKSIPSLFFNAALYLFSWMLLLVPLTPLLWAVRRTGKQDDQRSIAETGQGKTRSIDWLLWILPAAAFYLLFHMGQVGYILWFLVPVLGLLVERYVRGRHRLPHASRGLRRVLAVTLSLEILIFAAAPTTRRPYPIATGPEFMIREGSRGAVLGKLYRLGADYTAAGIRRWDGIIGAYLSFVKRFSPERTAIIVGYGREFRAPMLEYLLPEYRTLTGEWPTGRWVCCGEACEGIRILPHGDLTNLYLPAGIDTVVLIDEKPPLPGWDPAPDSALRYWGKMPYVAAASAPARFEDLNILFDPGRSSVPGHENGRPGEGEAGDPGPEH